MARLKQKKQKETTVEKNHDKIALLEQQLTQIQDTAVCFLLVSMWWG